MEGNELKSAEERGYAKGYRAGQKRKKLTISMEYYRRKRNAFWQRAFLAALPAAFSAQGWTRGDKQLNTIPERMRLASDAADEALKLAIRRL